MQTSKTHAQRTGIEEEGTSNAVDKTISTNTPVLVVKTGLKAGILGFDKVYDITVDAWKDMLG